MTMWTLNDALMITQMVETAVAAVGWHVALGGGVMKNCRSTHDLDLIFYPHDSTDARLSRLRPALRSMKWKLTHTYARVQRNWRTKGSADQKHVEVWKTSDGRRVDVIIPSITHEVCR